MENQNWEKEFNALFTEYSHEPTLISIRHFIRTLLTTHSNTLRAELAREVDKILWDWPREIVTTNSEAQKSYYREYLKKKVLALIQPDTTTSL